MIYKGYAAQIAYCNQSACLIGHLAGITDIVGFHADSMAQLRDAFEEAVDDYIEACETCAIVPLKAAP